MTLNLGGMQSITQMTGGIDYSSIITQLTQINRAPGDALNQTIQNYQADSNSWQSVNKLATTLQNDLVTLADPTTYQSYSTAVSGTDASSVTATADSTASPGTYNLSVTQVGTQASVEAGSSIGKAAAGTDSINTPEFSQPVTQGTLSVTVGSTTTQYTVGPSDTINSILTGILGSNATFTVSGNQVQITNTSGQNITFGSAGDTSNFLQVIGLAGQTGTGNFTSGAVGHAQLQEYLANGNFQTALTSTSSGQMDVNGVAITYNTGVDTLQSVISQINASSAGVTAAYDPISDKVLLTSKTSQPVSVSDVSGNLGQVLGLTSASATAPTTVAGQPWKYSINGGATLTSASSALTDVVPGVTMNLTTPSTASGSPISSTNPMTATVTVSQDTSALTKATNTFVADFNSLYTQLQQNTQQGGPLQGDAAMSQLGFQYMNDVLNPVAAAAGMSQTSVFGIGITNGAIGASPGSTNQLSVDLNQLETAFQQNPNEVQTLITGMAKTLNSDLVNLTGQFNTLTPITSSNSKMTSIAQEQENLYQSDITSTETQQQQIYNYADSQAQLMQQQFSSLQNYQAQMKLQSQVISALVGGASGTMIG